MANRIAWRTFASLNSGRELLSPRLNTTPGLARAWRFTAPPLSAASLALPTLPIASTWPDWRLPVRTPASGTTLNTSLSRYASPCLVHSEEPQAYSARLARVIDWFCT